MGYVLQGRQRTAVEAVLDFANLPAIDSTKESAARVTRCFGGFIESKGWKQPAAAQSELKRVVTDWLARIIASPVRERNTIRSEVAETLPTVQLAFDGNGRLVYDQIWGSASDMLSVGVALILDEDRKLTSRLQRCGWCGKFRLDAEGKPRRWCSDEHKEKYYAQHAAEKMRKWRAGKKRKAKKARKS